MFGPSNIICVDTLPACVGCVGLMVSSYRLLQRMEVVVIRVDIGVELFCNKKIGKEFYFNIFLDFFFFSEMWDAVF